MIKKKTEEDFYIECSSCDGKGEVIDCRRGSGMDCHFCRCGQIKCDDCKGSGEVLDEVSFCDYEFSEEIKDTLCGMTFGQESRE